MSTTRTKAETIEDRAARVAAELAEVRAEEEAREDAEYDRLTTHRAALDARTVETYPNDRHEAEAAVVAARAALEAAVAADPVTVAMVEWYAAQAHRRELFDRFIAARGRQGHDITGATYPRTDEAHLDELRERVARNAAQERTDDERARLDAAYDNPQED